jgi:hypothetical protein
MRKLHNLCPSGGGARMERPWLGADGNQNAAPVRDDPSLYTKCADHDGERAFRATIILVGAVIRPLLPRKMKVALSALRVAMKFRLSAFRSAQYGSIGFLVGRNLTARRSPLLHQTTEFAERVEQLFRIQ